MSAALPHLGLYDVVVIGGGPIGLSTAHECAKAGKRVLVLEKSIFFNQSGSSGDLVRMFRTAYTEAFMATLAHQSMSLWDDLETEAGKKLRLMTGLLNFGDPKYSAGPEGTLTGPIPNLKRYNMQYTELAKDEIQKEFPFRNLPDEWIGIDMKDNGCIDVTALTRTLFDLSDKRGVVLRQYAEVTKVSPVPHHPTGWVIEGSMGDDEGANPKPFKFITEKVAITCGAFTNHVLQPSFGFSLDLTIWEMVSAYYAIDSRVSFPKMWFQFAEDTKPGPRDTSSRSGPSSPASRSNLFYGFPSVPWGPPNISRIAVDGATRVIKDPHERSYSDISPEDLEDTRNWVVKHVKGVGPNPVPIFASECLQTNVFDNMFVLDFIPDDLMGKVGKERSKSIAVFTAGWAMKFVPLIGKVLKELLVDGGTKEYNILHFKLDRGGGVIIQKDGVNPSEKKTHPPVGYQSGSSLHLK